MKNELLKSMVELLLFTYDLKLNESKKSEITKYVLEKYGTSV